MGSTSKNLYLLNDVSSVVFRKNIINSSSLEIDLIVLKKSSVLNFSTLLFYLEAYYLARSGSAGLGTSL